MLAFDKRKTAKSPEKGWKDGLKFGKSGKMPEKPEKSPKIRKPIASVSKTNKNERRKFPPGRVEEVLERDGHKCVLCGWTGLLECHHVYFGSEANRKPNRNDADQLAMVCVDCHYMIHSS